MMPAGAGFVCRNSPQHTYPVLDGVIDFVEGELDTQLDVTTYDAQKQVSVGASSELFRHLKMSSNGAIRDDLGDVLEVGAGTGMLSLGMLSGSAFRSAVVTDVSQKMLLLNRNRMVKYLPAECGKITYATYAGTTRLFADSSFDLCIANSVLHHVENYSRMLSDLASATKPGGSVLFIEPAVPYHGAMSRSMADVICELITEGEATPADVRTIAAWVSDVRQRIAFSEDAERINKLEDKHLFSRERLAIDAVAAGFTGVDIVPNYIDMNGHLGCQEYARELGLPAIFFDRFFAKYKRYAAFYFKDVAAEDHSGMYICIFRR